MATRATTIPSKFDNLSDAALADEIGTVDTQAKALADRLKELKEELSRRGVEKAEGERFAVTKTEATRWTLDTKAVRDAMGAAWCDARSKVGLVTSFRISASRALAAAA